MIKNLNIDYKKVMLCFGLGSTITLGSITYDSVKNNGNIISVVEEVHYENEDLLNIFQEEYNNTSLNNLFSSVSNNLSEFILNYGEYLDQGQIINNLKNLKVIVDSNADSNNYVSYDVSSNKMIINKNVFYESSKKIEEEKLIAGFKFLFQSQFDEKSLFSSNLGKSIDDGFISLLLSEYGYDDVSNKSKEIDYTRVLCELMGKEKFLKAQCFRNISVLEDYLDNYIGREDTRKFIKALDKACADNNYGNEDDNDVWEYIDKIYYAKHNETIGDSNDYVMKILANKFFIKNYDIPGARTNLNVKLDKNYFINVDEAVIRYYQYDKLYGSVILNDENNIAYGSVLVNGFYDKDNNIVDFFGKEIDGEIESFGENVKKK